MLIGGPGNDILDGAPGDDVVIQLVGDTATSATAVGSKWLATHASTVKGKTVLKLDGEQRVLPRADSGVSV